MMDQALEVFFSWQTLLLCFLVSGITFAIRNVVEGLWPQAAISRAWSKAFVPVLPLLVGFGLAFIPGMPWPAFLGVSFGARAAYSFVCGMFSSTVYARYKDFTRVGAALNSKPVDENTTGSLWR